MGGRGNRMHVESLCRFLLYVLGRRPDEFGLVPSSEGLFNCRELLQALNEEEGWGHIRQAHINELMMGPGRELFNMSGKNISAVDRRYPGPAPVAPIDLPKLIYTPVRPRAHPVAAEKGVSPPEGRWLALTGSKPMALRMGRRKAPDPVLLEINASRAHAAGVSFFSFGDLFLTEFLPPECIIGPRVPPQPLKPASDKGPGASPEPAAKTRNQPFVPGSFTLSPDRDPDRGRAPKGRKPRSWKEKSRPFRKGKER